MTKSSLIRRSTNAKSSRSKARTLKLLAKSEAAPKRGKVGPHKRGKLVPTKHRESVPTNRKRLATLAKSVRANHMQCRRRLAESIQHALQVGRDLIAAKELCEFGQWLSWLERNCKLSEREAQRYMRFARQYADIANPTDLSDLPAMSRGLLAIATAKSTKSEKGSESGDQHQGNNSNREGDENDEENHDREDEEDTDNEEPEDEYDEGTDDDDSEAGGTDDEEDADSADEEDNADGTDDEEDGAASDDEEEDDEEEDDDEEEVGDLDAAIDRIVRLAEEMAVVAESHLDDLEPIETKAARRTLQKARKIIRTLLGTVSATRED